MTTEGTDPWTRIEVLADGQVVQLRVGGDIDQKTVEVLEKGLAQALVQAESLGARLLAVDLDEVGFLASVGLSVLIRAHNHAVDQKRGMAVILAPEHKLARLLWLTALTQVVNVTDSVEEALAKVGAPD
ncbi:STAS domain-containing protein [Saccharothrix coeruleofusca]|uniref:STAS domain-containing protein n=1 Tax=Saccharothrix coeruleofusca TaxID=33919 RepID=A0A918AUN2_9PSEU|nr:STAS domain-containing protein [Saccharothrix coeruleofusca]MBP2335853.1 anti-anti-sigma factor [Saccharothrix coeruleofusca]GGP87418.1 hypothetical protein GCM10010185_71300 [Saccharothrix coeruleofusca]